MGHKMTHVFSFIPRIGDHIRRLYTATWSVPLSVTTMVYMIIVAVQHCQALIYHRKN